MASTTAEKAIYLLVRKRRQRAPFRIQFLARKRASTLGFVEFITEDELHEHKGGTGAMNRGSLQS